MQIKNQKLKIKYKTSESGQTLTASSSKLKANFGFSLIELIIVVAIMLVVTSVTLFRQSKFSSDILITNMAYEVALSIRQAAVFGLSSRLTSEITNRTGYGVHFGPTISSDGMALGADRAFINFIEVSYGEEGAFDYFYNPQNDVPDGSPSELTQGQRIKRYCARVSSSSSWVCGPDDDNLGMSIVYVKPNPEAHISMGQDGVRTSDNYTEAIVVVESALGDKCRSVYISISGQVSVEPYDENGCERGLED